MSRVEPRGGQARPFLSPQGATFGRAEHAKAPHICELDGYYERQVVARL